MLGLLGWLLALTAVGLQPLALLALGTVSILVMAALAARWRWWHPGIAGCLGLLLGGAGLGPGLCLLALQAWAPQAMADLGAWGRGALMISGLGAAILACLPTPGEPPAGAGDAA